MLSWTTAICFNMNNQSGVIGVGVFVLLKYSDLFDKYFSINLEKYLKTKKDLLMVDNIYIVVFFIDINIKSFSLVYICRVDCPIALTSTYSLTVAVLF